MPKARTLKREVSSSSDSGPEDRLPLKMLKTADGAGKAETAEASGGDNNWKIGRERYIKLTQFKGKHYVDIRDYYLGKDGELKPGRKGIMLQLEQWQQLKKLIPEVDEAIQRCT